MRSSCFKRYLLVHPLNLPFDPVVNTPLGDSKFSQNHPYDIGSRRITVIDDDRHPQTLEGFAALVVGHHRKALEIGKVGSSNMGRWLRISMSGAVITLSFRSCMLIDCQSSVSSASPNEAS